LAAGFLRVADFFRVVAFLAAGFLRVADFFRVVAFLAAGFLRAAVFLRVALLVRAAVLLLRAGTAITFLIVGDNTIHTMEADRWPPEVFAPSPLHGSGRDRQRGTPRDNREDIDIGMESRFLLHR